MQQTLSTRGRWRFLPRTALAYDGSYTFVRYMLDDPFLPQNGDILRSRVGLTGLITNRLAFLGMAGWLATFYNGVPRKRGHAHRSGRAHVTSSWPRPRRWIQRPRRSACHRIAVGYNRDVSNSYLAAFYVRGPNLRELLLLLRQASVLASLEGGYSFITNPEDVEFESEQAAPLRCPGCSPSIG